MQHFGGAIFTYNATLNIINNIFTGNASNDGVLCYKIDYCP